MPRTAYFPSDSTTKCPRRSGIDITWTKGTGALRIGGWYDSIVGIEASAVTLREFFDNLGITEKDCAKAWKQAGGRGKP